MTAELIEVPESPTNECTAFYVVATGINGEYTTNKTVAEIYEAYESGRSVYCIFTGQQNGHVLENIPMAFVKFVDDVAYFRCSFENVIWDIVCSDYTAQVYVNEIAYKGDIPLKLPNPGVLTFTGAAEGSYDGSSDVTIDISSSNGNGGNADTLDGKHADEFVTNEQFNSLVGNTPVADQISDAIHENTEILEIWIYDDQCSHSASEIHDARESGKVIVVNGGENYFIQNYTVESDGSIRSVHFNGYEMNHDTILFVGFHVYNDHSIEVYKDTTFKLNTVVIVEDGIASYDASEINNIVWYGGVVKLRYNGYFYDYQYTEYINGNEFVRFICYLSDGNTKYTSIVTIDMDGNIGEIGHEEPIIPVPEETDVGKVLVAGSDYGEAYWENASGKTLTEHLAEEYMILSSLQCGDKLPGEDGEPYTHVPGRFFLRRVIR